MTNYPMFDDKLATLRHAIEGGVKADTMQALKLMELVDAIGEQFKREIADASAPAVNASARLDENTVARLKLLCRMLGLGDAISDELYADPEALFSIFGCMRFKLDAALSASTEAAAGEQAQAPGWRGDFERQAGSVGFDLSREEFGGEYCHSDSADAFRWYYMGRLDQACSSAPPVTSGQKLTQPGEGEGGEPPELLTCDFCGAHTDDPWHTSDAMRKHLHQCDACHSASGQKLTSAAGDVLAERERQVTAEGWTPEHDDSHDDGQMAAAAGYYALASSFPHERDIGRGHVPPYWPWEKSWWKPSTKRCNLVKAGALILAEIERIDRASSATASDNADAEGT
ncbi:hypothetical protein PPGU19_011550 [Paraburkholderia sp. PGU19]|uniref:hypothetical protein n=1 Tax=Paraburkholderia sp. PGU19 TaxID=2735434 RepID=UPI0015DAB5A8|nr:hypothetical protein [Paraburkholderia sp. PGU19]BCF96586.1 hypothetical protein PPGU19_011550 [Paraburkholderia sp. PGU19]